MKKERVKQGLVYVLIFIVMLVLFCIAMLISYALPNQRIQGHIKESKDFILKSNGNPLFGKYIEGAQLDEFTDLLILNTAMNKGKEENENLLVRTFGNSRFSEEGGNQYISIEQAMDNPDIQNNEEYPWYWHGIQAVLRPLLLFFNYEEIRFLFYMLMFLLLMIAAICISKNLSIMHAMAFLFSMLAVCFFIVPSSLQYTGVFTLTLLSVILVNLLYKMNKENLYSYLFFIMGGCTTFFDLLTSPLITLGIPLIIVVLLKNKKDCKIKESIIYIIKLSILWGISYATIFFAKWVISSIILQRNVIEVALKNIIFRVNGNDQYPAPRLGAILENLKYLYNTVLAILLIIITVIWGIIMVKNKKKPKKIKVVIPLIFITLYPYIWYFIFAGHSTIHSYFTYRIQAIAILGILCAMIESIDYNKMKNIWKEKQNEKSSSINTML